MKQYKSMINNNLINNNNYQNCNVNINLDNQNKNNNNLNNNHSSNDKELYINKLNYAEHLIILIQFYINEIKNFPGSINIELNYVVKQYIEELIFATQEICIKIYYNKDVFNKILPFYYKLILEFIHKQNIFIKILKDLEQQQKIDPSKYFCRQYSSLIFVWLNISNIDFIKYLNNSSLLKI